MVKVTIKRRSMSTGDFSSVILLITRSTKTEVLPEPAAAETSRVPPRELMQVFCCSVQCFAAITVFSFV